MRLVGALCALLLFVTACSDDGAEDASGSNDPEAKASEAGEQPGETVELQRSLPEAEVVPATAGTPGENSVAVSRALFVSSPAVVLAPAGDQRAVDEAADAATAAGIPLLLLDEAAATGPTEGSEASASDDAQSTSPTDGAEVPAFEEIKRLEADTVLLRGSDTDRTVRAALDTEVVSSAGDLPSLDEVEGLSGLAVLVVENDETEAATRIASRATANAAGAEVLATNDADIRVDPDVVSTLADLEPASVMGLGDDFGPAERFASRVDLAKTGQQLPGGGQALFPGRRLIALYGSPGTPSLGVLGEQDVQATIERAQGLAEEFSPLSDVPTVPTLEIIATIAHGDPGDDGDYSGEISVESLRPWVERAGEEGVYVVLDLQPGRSSFLDQAKVYEELLRMPHVGLALDAEWRLAPDEKPLGQIGHVEAQEVNSVITWLADLTAEESLPQKLLVLHQFRVAMLPDSQEYDLSREEVQLLVHMDGQGATGDKESTWAAVTEAAPDGVPFG